MPSSSSSLSSLPSDQAAAASFVDNEIDNKDGDTTTTSTPNTATGSSSSSCSSSTPTMMNAISKDELIELIKAVKFANPTYSQRDVYKEIVIAIPTKFPAYASSLNESTIVLNDVKKVWKKATAATSATKNKTTTTTTSANTNNDDDLAERLRQMDSNPEVFTIGVPTTTTSNTNSTSQPLSQSQSSASATAVAKEYLTQYIQEQAMLTEEKKRILLDEYVHVFLDIPADSNIGSKPHQALINFQNTNTQKNSNSNSSNKKGKNNKKKGRKGGNNSSTTSSTIQQQSSSSSSPLPLVALPFEGAIIVKIQMAAPLSNNTMTTTTKHPMLLYDKERKYKTFIHPNCALTSKTSHTTSIGNHDNDSTTNTTTNDDDNDNDDGYSRIAYWIDKSGIDGVLGSTGGTKAYFYGRLTTKSTTTSTPTTTSNHNRRILSIYVKELASSQQDW